MITGASLRRYDETRMSVRGIGLVLFLLFLAGVGAFLVFGIGSAPEPEPEASAASAAADETAPDAETPASTEETPAPEPAREQLPQSDAGSGTSVPAPPPDSAPLRGLLSDVATGEPLPFYLLRVSDASGKREDLFTDEQGRFASASPTPSGTIRIQPMDTVLHPRSLPEIVREHRVANGEAPDVDLSVPSGPTYRLAITPTDAVPPTEFRAKLFVINAFSAHANIDGEPVRTALAGEAPWIRFEPVPEDYDRAERIELQSRDGFWVGGAKVAAARGVAPDSVAVQLEARAVLEGRVVDAAGAVVAGASLTLIDEAVSKARVVGTRQTDKDGRYRYEALKEGAGTLKVATLRHEPQAAAVRLPAGFVATQDFVLQPLASAGDIRGRLESETGSFLSPIDVTLRARESAATAQGVPWEARCRVRWEEVEGRHVGRFEFTALPVGTYEVRVNDVRDSWLRWNPRSLTASPPSSELRFVVHDDLALAEFAFRARDADNGAKLDGVLAALDVKERRGVWRKLAYEAPVLERFPLELRFTWRLDLEGYRPAAGDEKVFSLEETRDGRVWKFAEVDLERGWQEALRILGGPKRKPLSGASVRLDGRDAGTSGNDGMVTVRSPERPRLIEVIYRDWKPTEPVALRPAGRRGDPEIVRMVAP
jgi:hypothetical protein